MPIKNQINREARGFLSFFRAKVGGQGPQYLRDDVQPVINVTPFYGNSELRGATTTATGNPPANLNIAVPSSEFWMIDVVHLNISTSTTQAADAGAVWGLQIQGLPDSDGVVTDLNLGTAQFKNESGTTAITLGGGCDWSPHGSVILPPGTNIQGQYIRDDTTSAYIATLAVLYTLISQ